jgi:glycosyltransferase involved in cell wall biosynthesis
MNILHVISTLDPEGGGPPLVVVRIAAAQAALGHKVTVLSYASSSAQDRISRSMDKVPNVGSVRFELLPNKDRSEVIFGTSARARLRKLIPTADWVHCHGVWERIIQTAATVSVLSKVPYCIRPAGMLDPWSLQQKKWKKRLALFLGYRRMLSRAAFIHALNVDEARLIGPLRLQTPIEVVPNGVFLEEISPLPNKGTFRRNTANLGQHPYVLFMARLHFKKGLDYLLDAFEKVAEKDHEVRLVIAGPDDGAEHWIRERRNASPYFDRILLVGALYGEEKFAALVDSAVFCLPSRQEGFSVAALEALACGVPIVISKASNFPEVGPAGAGFVVDLNSTEIAEGLSTVLGSERIRNDMAQAAANLVRERYVWPQIAARLVAHYEDYLQRRA